MKIITPTTNELMKRILTETETEIKEVTGKMRKEQNEYKKPTNENIK